MLTFELLVVGLIAGILSGTVGLGGGTIVVPALVLLFGFSQYKAQGTSLAVMLPPIGLLAAWTYHKNGNVDWRAAGLICAGFVLGGWFGAGIAARLSNLVLTRVFGVFIIVVGLKMLLAS